jgi:hypothetical protein
MLFGLATKRKPWCLPTIVRSSAGGCHDHCETLYGILKTVRKDECIVAN